MYILSDKMLIEWSEEKNKIIKNMRGVSFNEAEEVIRNGKVLETRKHHNQGKYGHQQVLYIEIKGYIYEIPYVKTEFGIFLKTMFPSRKITKEYKRKGLL